MRPTVRPTVLLYDIDGTLVSTSGAGLRAMNAAFAAALGLDRAEDPFPYDGMTDRAIARRGLEHFGGEATEAAIDALLDGYLAALEREVAAAACVVHPGMRESLDAVAGRAGFAVGLGTGNVRAGARIKLDRVGLHERFDFGGFGCDAELRPTLIRVGAERGAAALGRPLDACRVVVIGDTPHDVTAAMALGAECVGVGTGRYTADELRTAGATWAFPTLAAPGALEVLLGG